MQFESTPKTIDIINSFKLLTVQNNVGEVHDNVDKVLQSFYEELPEESLKIIAECITEAEKNYYKIGHISLAFSDIIQNLSKNDSELKELILLDILETFYLKFPVNKREEVFKDLVLCAYDYMPEESEMLGELYHCYLQDKFDYSY